MAGRQLKRGFSLVEILVVLAIIAILAGLLFPVLARSKAAAKQSACVNNVRQVGMAISLYMADYDDIFPHAVDPVDKFRPEIWQGQPEFFARIPYMPLIMDAVFPYTKSKNTWHCPADDGSTVVDNHPWIDFATAPSMYAMYHSSYFFRTEIAFKYFSSSQFQLPSNINVIMDAAGHWHGSKGRLNRNEGPQTYYEKIREYRYNVLFGDLHAKSLTFDQLQEAWSVDL